MSFFQKEERQKWLLFIVWCDSLISQSKRRIEQKTFAANQQKSIHFIFNYKIKDEISSIIHNIKLYQKNDTASIRLKQEVNL